MLYFTHGKPKPKAAAPLSQRVRPLTTGKGAITMITFSDLIEFAIFVVALISLLHEIFKGKK